MAKSKKSTSRSKSRKSSRPNKRIPPKNPDGSIKISMIKREYRLVEQHGNEVIVTPHFAFNKGPGDAAVKLARPFFKDRNDGSKVRITITKVSDGRNKGALYEYEILQKHMPLKKDEAAPKGIIIEKNGKKFRLKRYATKLKTYTPSSQKRMKSNHESAKDPVRDPARDDDGKTISAKTKSAIKEILSDGSSRGRVSKTISSARKDIPAQTIVNHGKMRKSKKNKSASSSTNDSNSDTHVSDSASS
jgi:hypothetical protein